MVGIVELMLLIAIIGVIAWAITTYIPMPQPIKGVIIVIAVIFCILLLIRAIGGVGLELETF